MWLLPALPMTPETRVQLFVVELRQERDRVGEQPGHVLQRQDRWCPPHRRFIDAVVPVLLANGVIEDVRHPALEGKKLEGPP